MSDTLMKGVQRLNSLKTYARELAQKGYMHRLQQSEMLSLWNAQIAALPKSTQQWVKINARNYRDGYWECFAQVNQEYLYKIDGKFYRLESQKNDARIGHFPCWNELPREQWNNLGKFGRIYWIYPDQEPALFFKPETSD